MRVTKGMEGTEGTEGTEEKLNASVNASTISCGGEEYEIWTGKSAEHNDQLLDLCAPQDVWFHVDGQSSAHVILRNPANHKLRKLPRPAIKRAACLCKASVKARGDCAVIYTERRNVNKTDVPGRVDVTNLKRVVV